MILFFLFAALPFIGVVIFACPLAIVFGKRGKKKLQNAMFVTAGIGAVFCIAIWVNLYFDVTYEKVQTEKGEVRVRSESVREFTTAILCDDVVQVKKCLQEEPALADYNFDSSTNAYGKAVESNSLRVVEYLLENGQKVDELTPPASPGEEESMEESAINFYCRRNNLVSDLNDTEEWSVSAEDSFKPEMVRLLLQSGSELSKGYEWEKPLLQNYLVCCCADSDFSEEEFELLEELEAAGMDMEAEFENDDFEDENGEIDVVTYFQRLAELAGIDQGQSEMYERVCAKLKKE
ncbi:MAG: hypothetical protein NC293_01805 [Roseburia sp.]|nr:hypothetical protein [Roseburia sp.]